MSGYTMNEREKERNEKERERKRDKEAERGEVQIRPDERQPRMTFYRDGQRSRDRNAGRVGWRRRDKAMTRGTEQENDKSRKWEKNGACCERKIED